jgi:hypothetical protein
MPIVETAADGALLNQGDILQGITLFATNESWNDKGGTPVKAPFKMCLVVSRPCVIANKESVIVAGVEKYPDQVPKEMDTFRKVLDFLTTMRDGGTTPDVFYLGHIPGQSGRFRAKFDSLHTIGLPPLGTQRDSFVKAQRIGTLHIDFCRALHVRLFTSFAPLGFDDDHWASDEDLKWLANAGQTELHQQEAAVSAIRTKKSSLEAQGKQFAEKELTTAQETLDELRAEVQPYIKELERRSTKRTDVPTPENPGQPSGPD